MKVTLRGYQEQAVRDVLGKVADARGFTLPGGGVRPCSFTLTAPTGAGKTVIASAVIEALLDGSTEYEMDADPNLVVLWVTSDAALNAQTRNRMMAVSDTLTPGRLIVVGEGAEGGTWIDQPQFTPGKVYFLNVQKFNDDSHRWTKTSEARTHSLWDTLTATYANPDLRVLVIVDEAHRGLGSSTRGANTVLRRILNGQRSLATPQDACTPAPLVWGVSATPERFEKAMGSGTTTNRHTHLNPPVTVETEAVRESGLLKDMIVLDSPDESGDFTLDLLREAVATTRDIERAWDAYTTRNGLPAVTPCLVVQVPNKPSDALLNDVVSTIYDAWPGLPDSAIVHVFGEHGPVMAAKKIIRYVSPEFIQDDPAIRVVLAKDAITTGWDCPRAEVLFSMRSVQEETVIAQMIGRIVRTPLARRIIGDTTLNAVACFLPRYNRTAVTNIINRFRTGADEAPPVDVTVRGEVISADRNPAVPATVWDNAADMPTYTTPKNVPTPDLVRVRRLAVDLADAVPEANLPATARETINAVLDQYVADHQGEFDARVEDILTASLTRTAVDLNAQDGNETTVTEWSTAAGERSIEQAHRAARRTLPEGVIPDYEKHLIRQADAAGDDPDYTQIKVQAAAVASLPGVVEKVNDVCRGLVHDWYATYKPHIQQAEATTLAVNDVMGSGQNPERIVVSLADRINAVKEPSSVTYPKHLYADTDGTFPAKAKSGWETAVLDTYVPDCVAWYRNPDTPGPDSLTIPYQDNGGTDENPTLVWRSLQPDFVFFHQGEDGTITRAIVDPHSTHLPDAVAKAKALARFAADCENAGQPWRSVLLVAQDNSGRLVGLDVTNPVVRDAVLAYEGNNLRQVYSNPDLATALA